MNTIKVGGYIKSRRKELGITQVELSEKLNISFQAVSKWETGNTIPDTSILLELSEVLGVSVDKILLAGKDSGRNQSISIKSIIEGFDHILKVKECFGEHSTFYKGMIKGINTEMNMELEDHLNNPNHLEVLYTEVIIQFLIEGYKVNMIDAETYIKNDKMLEIIKNKIEKYN